MSEGSRDGYAKYLEDREDSPEARAKIAGLLNRVAELESRVRQDSHTYCAFCDEQFPIDSPDLTDAIRSHVAECESHPLAARLSEESSQNLEAGKALGVLAARVAELEAENYQLKSRIAVENIPRDPLAVFEALREQALSVSPKNYEKVVDSLVRRISAERTLGDKAAEEIAELEAELEQERVRSAGCLTAAEGHVPDPPVKQGDYGWSPAYDVVLDLRKERDRLAGAGDELAKEAMKAHRYCLAHGFDYLNKALGRWKEARAAGRGEGAGDG